MKGLLVDEIAAAIRTRIDGIVTGGVFYPFMLDCPQFASHLVTDQMRNAPESMELPDPLTCQECNDTRKKRNPALEWQLQWRFADGPWNVAAYTYRFDTEKADLTRWVAVGVKA